MAEAKVYISGPIVADSSEAGNAYPYTTVEDVTMQLDWQKPFDAVRVVINSPGGRVDKGMAIYDYLRGLNGVTITTEAIGQCSSIATAVFLAGSVRIAHPHTESLVHLPVGGISGATAEQAQAWADEMARCEAALLALYVERAGVDETAFREIMSAQTTLVGQQLLDYGFATQVLEPATALAIVPSTASTSADEAANVPGWAHQFMSKITNALASMNAGLASLRKPATNQAATDATTNQEVTTDGGDTLSIDTGDRDTYAVGDAVTTADGTAAADGDYVLTDGNTISVASGAITAITPADTTDSATASAETEGAITQIAEAVTALAKQVGAMDARLTAATNTANRLAAATGSKATPSRAQAAGDDDKSADVVDAGKAAAEARAERRKNRFK